ncbi:MAG: hypothetical protein ACYC4T_05785 [Melioribacteraceae bacterium]
MLKSLHGVYTRQGECVRDDNPFAIRHYEAVFAEVIAHFSS